MHFAIWISGELVFNLLFISLSSSSRRKKRKKTCRSNLKEKIINLVLKYYCFSILKLYCLQQVVYEYRQFWHLPMLTIFLWSEELFLEELVAACGHELFQKQFLTSKK